MSHERPNKFKLHWKRTLAILGKEWQKQELKNHLNKGSIEFSECSPNLHVSQWLPSLKLLPPLLPFPNSSVQHWLNHPTHQCPILTLNHPFPIMSGFCQKTFNSSPRDKVHIPNLALMALHNLKVTFLFIPLYSLKRNPHSSQIGLLIPDTTGVPVSSQLFPLWQGSTPQNTNKFQTLLPTNLQHTCSWQS